MTAEVFLNEPLLLLIDRTAEHAEERHVAVLLGIVETVADNELVGHFRSRIVRLEILYHAALGFIEEGAYLYARGSARSEHLGYVMEGLAGIEDILDQKQIVALYRSVKVFDYLDFAGAFGSRAVALKLP